MKYPAVRMAIMAITFTLVWTLFEHFMGYNTNRHDIGQYSRLVPAFVFYFFVFRAVWLQRKQDGGVINFAKGLKIGAATAVLYGLLAALWFAAYAEIINPKYASTLKTFELQKLENAHAGPEQVASKLKELELSSGGSFLSYFLLFVFMTFFGCAVALASAFLLRKKQNTSIPNSNP
jgi:hypothetical protein